MPGRRRYYIKLSSLLSSPKVIPCAVFYGCGLGFLLISCIGAAHTNGVHVDTWTAGFNFPLVGVSLVLCMIGPMITPCRMRDRFTLMAMGFFGFLVIFGICAFFYTSVVCGQHASEIRTHAMARVPDLRDIG